MTANAPPHTPPISQTHAKIHAHVRNHRDAPRGLMAAIQRPRQQACCVPASAAASCSNSLWRAALVSAPDPAPVGAANGNCTGATSTGARLASFSSLVLAPPVLALVEGMTGFTIFSTRPAHRKGA